VLLRQLQQHSCTQDTVQFASQRPSFCTSIVNSLTVCCPVRGLQREILSAKWRKKEWTSPLTWTIAQRFYLPIINRLHGRRQRCSLPSFHRAEPRATNERHSAARHRCTVSTLNVLNVADRFDRFAIHIIRFRPHCILNNYCVF